MHGYDIYKNPIMKLMAPVSGVRAEVGANLAL